MKRLLLSLALAAAPVSLFANTYNFSDGGSLSALSHGTAYLWGLDPTTLTSLHSAITSGQHITSISITFTNVYDWTTEPGDILYVDALNGISSGVNSIVYNNNPPTYDTTQGPDYFNTSSATHYNYTAGQSDLGLVGTWSDPLGGSPHNNVVTLTLSAAEIATFATDLNADYTAGLASHDLGFGLGPDCHYYDSGVTAAITTAGSAASDRGLTLAMLGAGLIALAAFGRRGRVTA